MSNRLVAKVLIAHLPEITDSAYETATRIAIETLIKDVKDDWSKFYKSEIDFRSYLGLDEEKYKQWVKEEV